MQTLPKSLAGKLCAALILTATVLFIGHEFELYLPDLEVKINDMGVFAPLAFTLMFVVCTPAFISVDALCFVAGLLFPIVTGEVTVIIATYLSAAMIFYLGRHLFREKALAIIAEHQRFATLDKVISAENAFKLMFLLRLTPIPFALFSYALSVTQVKLWPYLAATSGILIYNGTLVYLGYTTKHLSTSVKGTVQTGALSHTQMLLGLLILLAILVCAVKIAGKSLKQLNLENAK